MAVLRNAKGQIIKGSDAVEGSGAKKGSKQRQTVANRLLELLDMKSEMPNPLNGGEVETMDVLMCIHIKLITMAANGDLNSIKYLHEIAQLTQPVLSSENENKTIKIGFKDDFEDIKDEFE